jgi:hypothetical protein
MFGCGVFLWKKQHRRLDMKKAKKQAVADNSNVMYVNDFFAKLLDEGDVVFEHEWDSGGPGAGAGSERVVAYRGRFWYSSLDFGVKGPYDDLLGTVAMYGLLTVTEATTEISSSTLSTAEMVLRLESAFGDMDRVEFTVNCDTYAYEKGSGFSEVHEVEADDEE